MAFLVTLAVITLIFGLFTSRLALFYANWNTTPFNKQLHFAIFIIILPFVLLQGGIIIWNSHQPSSLNSNSLIIIPSFLYACYLIFSGITFPIRVLRNLPLTFYQQAFVEIFGNGYIKDPEQQEQQVEPTRRPDDTSFARVGLDSYLKNKDDPELVLGPTDIARVKNLEKLFYKELEEKWVAEGHYYEITPDLEIQHEQRHEFWETIDGFNKKRYKKKKLIPIPVAYEKDGKRYAKFERFPVFFYGWKFDDTPYRNKATLMAVARVVGLDDQQIAKFISRSAT
ncbi:MAG: hypothetical protein QXN55_01505 [Candidatus Nitrosotenuis sp.]